MIKNIPTALFLVLSLSGCRREARPTDDFQGVVEYEDRLLAFESPGRIVGVNVRRGDVVKDGDVLAQLDDKLERFTREARANEAEGARADLALLEAGAKSEDVAALAAQGRAAAAQEELLKKNLERTRSLHATGAIAEAELDRVKADLDRATAQRQSLDQQVASLRRGARTQELARARARANSADAALALEDERLARYTLRSRNAGMVLDVHVEPGELAAQGTPAATVADTTHPYVDVFVPQGALEGIHVGSNAQVRVDATTTPFSGNVEFISPRTEFTPRFLFSERERPNLVIRVRIRISDPMQRLHAGVPSFVRIDR